MRLIAVVDNGNGMMFAGRRLSKDSALRKRILARTSPRKLWFSHYTFAQFMEEEIFDPDILLRLNVDDDYMSLAGEEDYVWNETIPCAQYEDQISAVILYRWNRDYPSDVTFDLDMGDASKWKLIRSSEFAGFSHERITEEVYARCPREASD